MGLCCRHASSLGGWRCLCSPGPTLAAPGSSAAHGSSPPPAHLFLAPRRPQPLLPLLLHFPFQARTEQPCPHTPMASHHQCHGLRPPRRLLHRGPAVPMAAVSPPLHTGPPSLWSFCGAPAGPPSLWSFCGARRFLPPSDRGSMAGAQVQCPTSPGDPRRLGSRCMFSTHMLRCGLWPPLGCGGFSFLYCM